jgi:hypothetical protein
LRGGLGWKSALNIAMGADAATAFEFGLAEGAGFLHIRIRHRRSSESAVDVSMFCAPSLLPKERRFADGLSVNIIAMVPSR